MANRIDSRNGVLPTQVQGQQSQSTSSVTKTANPLFADPFVPFTSSTGSAPPIKEVQVLPTQSPIVPQKSKEGPKPAISVSSASSSTSSASPKSEKVLQPQESAEEFLDDLLGYELQQRSMIAGILDSSRLTDAAVFSRIGSRGLKCYKDEFSGASCLSLENTQCSEKLIGFLESLGHKDQAIIPIQGANHYSCIYIDYKNKVWAFYDSTGSIHTKGNRKMQNFLGVIASVLPVDFGPCKQYQPAPFKATMVSDPRLGEGTAISLDPSLDDLRSPIEIILKCVDTQKSPWILPLQVEEEFFYYYFDPIHREWAFSDPSNSCGRLSPDNKERLDLLHKQLTDKLTSLDARPFKRVQIVSGKEEVYTKGPQHQIAKLSFFRARALKVPEATKNWQNDCGCLVLKFADYLADLIATSGMENSRDAAQAIDDYFGLSGGSPYFSKESLENYRLELAKEYGYDSRVPSAPVAQTPSKKLEAPAAVLPPQAAVSRSEEPSVTSSTSLRVAKAKGKKKKKKKAASSGVSVSSLQIQNSPAATLTASPIQVPQARIEEQLQRIEAAESETPSMGSGTLVGGLTQRMNYWTVGAIAAGILIGTPPGRKILRSALDWAVGRKG